VNGRAWTFQERILAQRCLIFNESGCVWECRTGCKREGLESFKSKLLLLEDPTSSGKTPIASAPYDNWLKIVRNYSKRDLSTSTDKLPAIAAIAQHIAKITDDLYFAGVWRGDLLRQLTWNPRKRKRSSRSTLEMLDRFSRCSYYPPRSLEYIAPSWGWASWKGGEVQFQWRAMAQAGYEAEIVDISAEVSDVNPFGAARSAQITMRGIASPAILTLSYDKGKRKSFDETCRFNPHRILYVGSFYQDLTFPDDGDIWVDYSSILCHRHIAPMKCGSQPDKLMLVSSRSDDETTDEQQACSGQVTLFWISDLGIRFYCSCAFSDCF
jgi:hypothetical protein